MNEKQQFSIDPYGLIRGAVTTAAGIGAMFLGGELVAPIIANQSGVKKILCQIGSYGLSGAAGTIAAKEVGNTMDIFKHLFDAGKAIGSAISGASEKQGTAET